MQTWEELLETGNGAVEYRLEIEGFRYNFVTAESLVMHSGSYVRLPGLTRAGMTIHYSTEMVDRRLKAGGMTFNIVDNLAPLSAFDEASGSLDNDSHGITEAFSFKSTKQTFLRSDLDSSSTTVEVEATDGWSTGDIAHIGTEAIYVGVVDAANRRFLGCTRGYLNTIAQSHKLSSGDGTLSAVYITDAPLMLERRRCYLYAYGDGDDPSGPGTLIWRGLLTNEKELVDGTTWRLTARHVSELSREKFGGGFGEAHIRGIYHPTGYGFALNVYLLADNNLSFSTPTNSFVVIVDGFHETRDDFVAEVSRQLRARSLGWATQVWAELDSAGRMVIMFQTDGTNKAVFVVNNHAGLHDANGLLVPFEEYNTQGDVFEVRADSVGDAILDPDSFVLSTQANRTYKILPRGAASTVSVNGLPTSYPLRVGGYYNAVEGETPGTGVTYPSNRLFLDFPSINPAINTLRAVSDTDDGEEELWFNILSVDSSSGSIDADIIGMGPRTRIRKLMIDDSHEFKAGIELVHRGSVVDALERLTEIAPDNRELMPFLSSNDIDIADMRTELNSSGLGAFVTERNYSLFDSELRLEEYLAEEYKLAGMIPSINPDNQKITWRRMRFGSINEETTAVFDETNVLTDNQLPRYQESKEHIRNFARLRTGYSFEEDEHFGRTYEAVFRQSVGSYGTAQYEIAPMSRENVTIDAREVEIILFRPIAILGAPYAHIQFEAPFIQEAWDLVPGSIIRLTNIQLPDTTSGTRGISNRTGYVTGINKNLNEGRIAVEALVSLITLAGYTPTAVIMDSSFGKSGIIWDMTLHKTHSLYAPEGSFDYQWFEIGDRVRVEEFNSWTPQVMEATIASVASETSSEIVLRLHMDATPSFSDAEGYRLRYVHYSGSVGYDNQQEQQTWVYLTSGSLTGEVPARYFGA